MFVHVMQHIERLNIMFGAVPESGSSSLFNIYGLKVLEVRVLCVKLHISEL